MEEKAHHDDANHGHAEFIIEYLLDGSNSLEYMQNSIIAKYIRTEYIQLFRQFSTIFEQIVNLHHQSDKNS